MACTISIKHKHKKHSLRGKNYKKKRAVIQACNTPGQPDLHPHQILQILSENLSAQQLHGRKAFAFNIRRKKSSRAYNPENKRDVIFACDMSLGADP